MTALERAIHESKERDERATKGPWELNDREGYASKITYNQGVGLVCQHVNSNDTAEFIAASRTWEPKWREMVESMLKVFRSIDAEYADQTQGASETLGKIAIRSCEALTELERLAKEGF